MHENRIICDSDLFLNSGHYNLVKVLVENHAEINARNNEGYTSLHLAAQNGHGDVVKFLIQNGAIVNIEDVYGFTPLDRAIIFGNTVLKNCLNKVKMHCMNLRN